MLTWLPAAAAAAAAAGMQDLSSSKLHQVVQLLPGVWPVTAATAEAEAVVSTRCQMVCGRGLADPCCLIQTGLGRRKLQLLLLQRMLSSSSSSSDGMG
jgi:hypothetical protein